MNKLGLCVSLLYSVLKHILGIVFEVCLAQKCGAKLSKISITQHFFTIKARKNVKKCDFFLLFSDESRNNRPSCTKSGSNKGKFLVASS